VKHGVNMQKKIHRSRHKMQTSERKK